MKQHTFPILYSIKKWQSQDLRVDKRTYSESVSSKHMPGFQWSFVGDLLVIHLSKPTPHTPWHPAFTFHRDWRRLSVSVKHRAKLNISLSVSLLPDSFKFFFPFCPPPLSLHLPCIWPLIAFSPLHKSPPSAQNCACFGGLLQVSNAGPSFNSQGQSYGI